MFVFFSPGFPVRIVRPASLDAALGIDGIGLEATTTLHPSHGGAEMTANGRVFGGEFTSLC